MLFTGRGHVGVVTDRGSLEEESRGLQGMRLPLDLETLPYRHFDLHRSTGNIWVENANDNGSPSHYCHLPPEKMS